MLRIMNYILLPRLWLARHVQNQSRITPMRRICSSLILFLCELICAFTVLWFLRISITLWTIWGLSLAGVYPAPSGAIIIRNKSNIKWNIRLNEIREKIKSVASALSVNLLSACGLSRRRRSTTMWYCLPDSLSLLVYNPETSSQVTLAALGTVFQTDN